MFEAALIMTERHTPLQVSQSRQSLVQPWEKSEEGWRGHLRT